MTDKPARPVLTSADLETYATRFRVGDIDLYRANPGQWVVTDMAPGELGLYPVLTTDGAWSKKRYPANGHFPDLRSALAAAIDHQPGRQPGAPTDPATVNAARYLRTLTPAERTMVFRAPASMKMAPGSWVAAGTGDDIRFLDHSGRWTRHDELPGEDGCASCAYPDAAAALAAVLAHPFIYPR